MSNTNFDSIGLQAYRHYDEAPYQQPANLAFSGILPPSAEFHLSNFEDGAHEESPISSTGSSPKPQVHGNRARSLSLNAKLSHGRSTAHITQQQINKKRQRATPEQLIVLEEAFAVNPSPNAKTREHISSQINMTERSVQIWFQNRRAKTKLLHRKGGFEDLNFPQSPYGQRPGLPSRSYSIDQNIPDEHALQGLMPQVMDSRAVVIRLNCRSLTIGTWRRVACTSTDLVCYFAKSEANFTYYINSGASGFKIQYPVAEIAKVELKYVQSKSVKELGRAIVTIIQPPLFFMEVPNSPEWKQCTDFTENHQATTRLEHAIVGPYENLKQSFTELASLFPETIGLMSFEDLEDRPMPEALAAPISFEHHTPIPTRSLQSAKVTTPEDRTLRQPHASSSDASLGTSRGMHRRTRSRSAPIAMDFSQFLNHNNVGGMPGYAFGQQSLRIDPHYRLNPEQQAMSAATSSYDYSEALFTPTTGTTPTYQDPWYISSYANTPLLGAERSQLGSPMMPLPAQFDISAGPLPSDGYSNGFPLVVQAVPNATSMPHLMNPNQSMPELPRLNSVPEIPVSGQQAHFDSSIAVNPLDISQMDFTDMPPALLHDSSSQMEQ